MRTRSVIGADVYNEPTGGTWAEGKETDFDVFAVEAARAIHNVAPGWLIFVQGTMNSPDCKGIIDDLVGDVSNGGGGPNNCHAGDNLRGAQQNPVVLDVKERLVYSPHTYGPAVRDSPEFSSTAFPDNMIAVWNRRFGRLVSNATKETPAVVFGEWGGPVEGDNEIWMLKLISYLKNKNMESNFFWQLGMAGEPIGLILDWAQKDPATGTPLPPLIDHDKLRLLEQLVPNPTPVHRDQRVAAKMAQEKAGGLGP